MTQRYIVTAEFVLQNPSDYSIYRTMIENFFKAMGCRLGCQSDYVSVVKATEEKRS